MEKQGIRHSTVDPLLPKPYHIVDHISHHDADSESQITSIHCYKFSYLKFMLYILLCMLTGGVTFLLSWWFLKVRLGLMFSKCKADYATHVYVTTLYHQEIIPIVEIESRRQGILRTFQHHFLPYFYSGSRFEPLYFQTELTYKHLIQDYGQGLDDDLEVEDRRRLYGKCEINVPVKSVGAILLDEIFHPFYMFQIFSIALWMWDGYRYYASAILIITTISITTELIETRRNLKNIAKMAHYNCDLTVIRRGEKIQIQSVDLVPGDLIEVSNGRMPCDAVLLSGGCIVDEAMLTGESTPVIKDHLPYQDSKVYEINQDKRYSLYEGTFVIQTRSYGNSSVVALVTRTNFLTMKGRLVRTILFPKPAHFKFYSDSMKFIAVLGLMGILGYGVTLPFQLRFELTAADLVDRSLDLITVTVPPALPAAMTIGSVFAINRLRKNHQIYCISPPRMNVAGKVNCLIFDKTGTLTEDGMDLHGVQGVVQSKFIDMMPDPEQIQGQCRTFVEGMACCHSLTIINGELKGDSQDQKLFESTKWSFIEPEGDQYHPQTKAIVKQHVYTQYDTNSGSVLNQIPHEVEIMHIFHFNSKLKRMAAIVKPMGENFLRFYMKGAPEIVIERCNPNSIPHNFDEILGNYTREGFRVLGLATKSLPGIQINQLRSLELEKTEQDLEFLGLVILQNRLKIETIPVINRLHKANIRTVMATGDALLTGISVGRECGIVKQDQEIYFGELINDQVCWTHYFIDEQGKNQLITNQMLPADQNALQKNFSIALTGSAFQKLVKNGEDSKEQRKFLRLIIEKGQIFARMSPEHKSILVEHHQGIGNLTGMCGDGANDCGALKTADIGISLSEAEASIAAPFTSSIPNISCVEKVLAEGRCSLATSIQCFKYMALYSTIQFTTVTILYVIGSNLSDLQFMIVDLITILPLAFAMCYTGPLDKISEREISGSLISAPILSSIVGQTAIQIAVQAFFAYNVTQQDFYEPPNTDNEVDGYYCYMNTVLFLISNFSYLIMSVVYSIGHPWKKSAYTNLYLVFFVTILLSFSVYIITYPADWARSFAQIKHLPYNYRLMMLGIAAVYAIVAYCFERVIINWLDIVNRRRIKQDRFWKKMQALS